MSTTKKVTGARASKTGLRRFLQRTGILHLHWRYLGGDASWVVLLSERSQVCDDSARCLIFRLREVVE